MSDFVLAMLSMTGLTVIAWLARKVSRAEICPVCIAVAGTWLWMLAARAGGIAIDTAVLALLLGASVVGVAQWIETRLPAGRSPLSCKALTMATGFAAAYGLVAERWPLALVAAAVLGLLAAFFLRPQSTVAGESAVVAQLEERMKKCC